MRRRLILLRHAKSAWDTSAPTDHARPLNGRGRRDAPAIGARLAQLGWAPDLVAMSDAERTRETWARMADHFASDTPVAPTRVLYHADITALRSVASQWVPRLRTVWAIGHNPGWESILAHLSGRDERLTTCNAAMLLGEGETWPEAIRGRWRLVGVLRPKELGSLPQALS
jgi:phosphohistidine phosphatase